MTADRAHKPDRESLRRLQDLFVRLLFCDATFARYRAAPADLAREYGLDDGTLAQLPPADSPQLLAERHGRKTGVLRELEGNFPNAWPAFGQVTGFEPAAFLSSDAFYDPDAALPHPDGIGPGYENSSKFFFWAKRALGIDRPGAPVPLRTVLMGDFASYLVGQYARCADRYYDRFANGIYWREAPGAGLPLLYMTVERHFFRYEMDAQLAELRRRGAFDLDTLAPEPATARANIF